MGGTEKNAPPNMVPDQSRKSPVAPTEDDDIEDDFATPKRDRDDEDEPAGVSDPLS